jgi:hypothetical protein
MNTAMNPDSIKAKDVIRILEFSSARIHPNIM